jgi:hypothetical protein
MSRRSTVARPSAVKPRIRASKSREVIVPDVPAWVEEGGYLTRVGIERSDTRSLLQVAPDAAKTKIIDIVSAMVLAPNDVIDLVR